MFVFEKLSNSVALKISSVMDLDRDREEIIAYGAYAVLHTLWSTSLVLIFAWIFNVLVEAIFILFVASALKRYSGGAHATSPNRCAVLGILIFDSLAFIVAKIGIYLNNIVVFICIFISFVLTYYIVYRKCPVDTPNKRITKAETKIRLRKKTFHTIHFLLGLTIILFISAIMMDSINLLNIIVCICIGLAWQAFTLTSPGQASIHFLDGFLDRMTEKMGGKKR